MALETVQQNEYEQNESEDGPLAFGSLQFLLGACGAVYGSAHAG